MLCVFTAIFGVLLIYYFQHTYIVLYAGAASQDKILFYGDFLYFLLFKRLVRIVGIDGRDFIKAVKAVRHFAESGILTVKVRSVLVHNEKL